LVVAALVCGVWAESAVVTTLARAQTQAAVRMAASSFIDASIDRSDGSQNKPRKTPKEMPRRHESPKKCQENTKFPRFGFRAFEFSWLSVA
jgi:hypothetical protein